MAIERKKTRLSLPASAGTRRAAGEGDERRSTKPYARQRAAAAGRTAKTGAAAGGEATGARAAYGAKAGYRKRAEGEGGEGSGGAGGGYKGTRGGYKGAGGGYKGASGGYKGAGGGYKGASGGYKGAGGGYKGEGGGYKGEGGRFEKGGYGAKGRGEGRWVEARGEGGEGREGRGGAGVGRFGDKPGGFRKPGAYDEGRSGSRGRTAAPKAGPAFPRGEGVGTPGRTRRAGDYGRPGEEFGRPAGKGYGRQGGEGYARPAGEGYARRARGASGETAAAPYRGRSRASEAEAPELEADEGWTLAEVEAEPDVGPSRGPEAEAAGRPSTPKPAAGGRVGALALRKALIATTLKMNEAGINRGKSGNVSVRDGDGFLITPTAVDYERLAPEDIVRLGADGTPQGRLAPSSEWRFHRDLYAARPDCGAVVHAHAPYATTLACLRRGVPAFHYMVAIAGGEDIRCASYATFGTQELSDRAVAALEGRKACLLANHGLIAIGSTLDDALALAVEVEALCAQYWRALQIGDPVLLPPDEMARVLEKFATYGQPQPAGTEPPKAKTGDA